jgi:hypothetical protein
MTTTFLIGRFIHSRLVLWNKHHQARPVAYEKKVLRFLFVCFFVQDIGFVKWGS